jgi:hypothetical protein
VENGTNNWQRKFSGISGLSFQNEFDFQFKGYGFLE